MSSYSEKLEKLFAYGTPESVKIEDWPDYLAAVAEAASAQAIDDVAQG